MADGSVRIDTKLDTSKLNKQMGILKGNLTKGFKSLAKASTIALGGITTAIGLVAGASVKITKAGDRVDKLSQKIGISRTAFQEWDFILSQSGASVEGLQMSVKTLSNAAAEARDGTAEYKDEFDRLAISVTDTNGKMKDQETLFNEVFGALSDMKDETQRTATASKLLGRSATELAPAMNAGSDGIEEMRGKAHDLGLILKDETIDAGVKLTDSLDQLKRTGTALMSEFLGPILPYINDLIQSFIDMTKGADDAAKTFGTKMGDVIQTIIDKITEFLPKALTYGGKIILEIAKGILNSLPKLIEQVAYMLGFMIGTIISKLPNFFNQGLALLNEIWKGMKEIAPKIGTWLSGILTGLEKQITDFWENGDPWLVALASGIAAVAAAVVVYKVALLAAKGAAELATIAQLVFNTAMDANPVGLVIIGIGALVAAIVLLIKKWDAVKAKVKEVWDGFNDFLENLLGFRIDLKAWRENIAKIFNGFVDDVNKTFGIEATSSTVFSELGKTLLQSFLDGFNSIKDTVKNAISGVFNGFVTTVEGIFGIKTTSSTVFSDIGENLLQGFIDGFNGTVKEVKDTVFGLFGGIGQGVRDLFGEKSPSKVFKDIAVNVDKGFIQGIEDGKAGVIRTAESLGEDVIKATTEGASSAHDAGVDAGEDYGSGVDEGSSNSGEDVKATWKETFDSVVSIVNDAIDITADGIESFNAKTVSKIGDTIASIGVESGNAVMAVGGAVVSMVGKVIDFFVTAKQRAIDFNRGLVSISRDTESQILSNKMATLDAEYKAKDEERNKNLQAELAAAGLLDKTKAETLQEELADAKKANDTELQATLEKEIKKQTILDKYAKQKEDADKAYAKKKAKIDYKKAVLDKKIAVMNAKIARDSAIADLGWFNRGKKNEVRSMYAELISAIQSIPLPSYSVGGVIDRDQVATVHAGETILPKGITSDMRSAGLMIQPLGMGTQSQTIYGIINLDGRKVAQAVFKHTDENVGLAYTG